MIGGALFGILIGTILVSFSSSIGASIAFLSARFLLSDWVQDKYKEKLITINNGIEKQGAYYLFTLRLIPLIPFFVINLAMGLTKMPLKVFYLVSQIGMLPATILYVNAGKELGKLESLSGILSPGLIVSFVILGVFPIILKKSLAWYKMRGETK